jgi:RNA polymerase-binding transcription factor DksA
MTSTRERIEGSLRRAEAELQHLDERLQDRPNFGPGRGSVGGYSWEMALARRKTVPSRIEALKEALIRVGEGTYGLCKSCGVQIASERLEILPATTRCAACARSSREGVTSKLRMGSHSAFQ